MGELYQYHQWSWRRQEKRTNHYSSGHYILLVGEGDFSFSLSLAKAFANATNIVATSFDTYGELIKKYRNAKENLAMLKTLGASLFHGVDATKMSVLNHLQWKKFHRIIFNFPHAGFLGKEHDPQLINKHRDLVRGFLRNARIMLILDGEIHISHKVTPPFTDWKIEELATKCSLFFIGLEKFRIEDYPGYENKRGASSRADEPFPLGECRTYKFGLRPYANCHLMQAMSLTFQAPFNMKQQAPVPLPWHPSPSSFTLDGVALPNGQNLQGYHTNECHRIFGSYLNHVEGTFGSVSYDVQQSVREALRHGFETYMSAMPGRPLNGYIGILEELHQLSSLRSKRLRQMLHT